MERNVEVELRGPLKKEQFVDLRSFLRQNGSKERSGDRLSLIYFRGKIPSSSEEIKSEKVDLRLRITAKKPEIVLKYGSWAGSDARKEYSFDVKKEQFTQWIEFLTHLGWSICVAYATKHETYTYQGVEFTIVEIIDVGYSFEAEVLSEDDSSQVKETKERIATLCKKLNLTEYAPGEFEAQCDSINNKKEIQYDFRKDNPAKFIERFKDFF